MANMKETKATITGVLEKLKKSIDREDSYKKSLKMIRQLLLISKI